MQQGVPAPPDMKRHLLFIAILLLFFSSADKALAQAVQPTINPGPATGTISACYGTASASPEVLQFTASGAGLTGDITAIAPTGFEVSLSSASGYGPSVSVKQTGGVASGTVYVRSSATAAPGPIGGSVKLTSAGAADRSVNVNAIINALPTINPVTGPSPYNNGDMTTAIDFTGTGNSFTWTNNTPSIGLPTSGTGSIPSFMATNTGTSPVQATIQVTPVSYTYGFAPNPGALLTVFNISTNQQVGQIDVGDTPTGVSVSPDGKNVYVTCLNDNKVYVINIATMAVIAKIDVGSGPRGVVVSPDSKKVYVANENSNYVSVIDATTKTVSPVFVGLDPYGIAISPDGSKVYVTNSVSNTVSVINTSNNSVTTITGFTTPIGVAVSPDGTKIYVANSDIHTNTVSVISAATNQILSTFNTGTQPLGLCLSPDGSSLYVTNGVDGSVSVINAATGSPVTTIMVESTPFGISINRDGSEVFVANMGTGDISVINTTSNTVTGMLPIGALSQTLGNFLEGGTGCTGSPVSFTIKVNPQSVKLPTIAAGPVTGTISACYGSASASPQIEQFTVSGANLLYDITVTARPGFEVSLDPGSGYGPNIPIAQSGGTVNPTTVYVRSSASAGLGQTNDFVDLTSGPTTQTATVSETINPLPTVNNPSVNTISGLTFRNGEMTTVVDFTGTADSYTWTNDNPSIGLAASGTGNLPSFLAVNSGAAPVTANVVVTPVSNAGCSGKPIKLTITIDAGPPPATITTSASSLPGLNTDYGKFSSADAFTVSGSNLTGGIIITSPLGFEISANDITFSKTLTVGSGGNLTLTQIYIRLAATTPAGNNYHGDITLTNGSVNQTVAIGTSVVNPIPLTIQADNETKYFGQANPVLGLTYIGFVNGDKAAQLTQQPVVTTIAVTNSAVGTYTIQVTGGASPNYSPVTDLDGTLTVLANPLVVEVPNTFTPNGDGINDTWNIKNIDAYPNCSVEIYNRYGENVYSSIGYGTPWSGTYRGAALPSGTYYYMINLKNGSKVIAGYVAIIR